MVFKWCSRQFGGERPLGAASPERASAPELSTAPFEHQGVRPPRKGVKNVHPHGPHWEALEGQVGSQSTPVEPSAAPAGAPTSPIATKRQRFGSVSAAFPQRSPADAAHTLRSATVQQRLRGNVAETLPKRCVSVALGDVGAPAGAAEGSTGVDLDPTCPPSAPHWGPWGCTFSRESHTLVFKWCSRQFGCGGPLGASRP